MKTVMGTDMTMVSLKTADRLRTLERAWDRLAEQVDVCEGSRDLALLVARLQSVMAKIAELARRRSPRRWTRFCDGVRSGAVRVCLVSAARTEGRGVGREHRHQSCFDLAQLDAVAADLHLVIRPTQVLQPAVWQVFRPSPVRYNRAPAPANGSATNRSAVIPLRPM